MMDEGTVRQIVSPEEAYTNCADDRFMMQIHFAMARKSSDDTSRFVRRDVESKLLKGEYPGMVPPGYLNINREGHTTRGRDNPALLKLDRPLRREEIDPVEGPLVASFSPRPREKPIRWRPCGASASSWACGRSSSACRSAFASSP